MDARSAISHTVRQRLAGAACHDQGRHQACGQRQAALSVAQADVIQAEADVHQIRVSLGLLAQPESGDLGEVPPDLNRTFSSVREAQAALIQTAAQLGVTHSYEQLPKEMLKQFESLDQGDVDRTLAALTDDAPAVKQAEAKLKSAKRDLVQVDVSADGATAPKLSGTRTAWLDDLERAALLRPPKGTSAPQGAG